MLRLLTQREAADLLRPSGRTLERLRVTGTRPVYVKAHRRVLYEKTNVSDRTSCSKVPLVARP